MIILIGGEKGGTGKTTLTTNLAARRLADGGDVLIIDTDKQGSASAWAATRDEHGQVQRIPSIQKFGSGLGAEIRDLRKRYSDVIIDAGGRDSVELRASMTIADRLYIPIQASQFDVWTLGAMDEIVASAKGFNPGLTAHIVINRASTNPSVSEADEAQELLADFDHLQLCSTIMYDRIAFRKAAKGGLSVLELQPQDAKAVAEVEALYAHVFSTVVPETTLHLATL